MKHYFHPMSRSTTTDWMLRELQVPHERITIDLTSGKNRQPDFLKVNPMGKLPALEDNGVVITEVAAICTYLADKFIEKGLAPSHGSIERAHYYRLLFLAGNTVEPALTLIANGVKHLDAKSTGWGDMLRVLATLEDVIPQDGWLLGSQFSTADVVLGGLLDSILTFTQIEVPYNVATYVERLRIRPAYIAANSVMIDVRAKNG